MSLPHQQHDQSALMVRLLTVPLRYCLLAPRLVLLIALLLGGLSIYYTWSCIGYKAGRNDLVATDREYNQRWLAYCKQFGDQDDAVIIIQGDNREQVLPAIRHIVAKLAQRPQHFQSILHQDELEKLRAKGLHYLNPTELQRITGAVAQAAPLIQGNWSQLQISNAIQGLFYRWQMLPAEATEQRQQVLNDLQRYTQALLTTLSQPEVQPISPWPQNLTSLPEVNSDSLLTADGRQGLILLKLDRGADKMAPYQVATAELRDLIASEQSNNANLKFGLTGLPILENDEMQASQSSMLWASIISLVGVVIVIIAAFGGWKHALLANMVLLLGMSWAFAYATFSVGHLNILSITFTATLIGVGIDYGTYYVARYLQIRNAGTDAETAVLETSAAVGPGIMTGAITTAVSFFSAAWTSFPGVAELGIIAGGGLILCAVAQLFVLPVCLVLVDRRSEVHDLPAALPLQHGFRPLWRSPKFVATLGMAATLLLGMGLPQLWYDYNLLNMQADNLESVAWEKQLLTTSGRSVWYAVSVTDSLTELKQRRAEFAKQPGVDRIEEITTFVPQTGPQELQQIQSIATTLKQLPDRVPLLPVDNLESLQRSCVQIEQALSQQPETTKLLHDLGQIRHYFATTSTSKSYQRLSDFQQHSALELLQGLKTLKEVADPVPPQLLDLPPSLVQRFMAQSGNQSVYLLKVYGRGDIWDMSSLSQFVSQVRSVDPHITGHPLQAYEASREMRASFEQAAGYALVIIMVVLWLDFRSIRYSLLAALPLMIGIVQTFGLMGWINQPLNPANMIALPLIMGIGVDYGVHIVHNFLEQRGRNYEMTPATLLAIGVDALTTIIGFGSLMIASHQGLYSLGRVLTLGITFCTLTSLILLPILLRWVGQWQREPATETEHAPTIPNIAVSEETVVLPVTTRPIPSIRQSGSGLKNATLAELMN